MKQGGSGSTTTPKENIKFNSAAYFSTPVRNATVLTYLKFIKGNKKIFFNDVQVRGLIYILIISVLIMFIYLLFNNKGYGFLENLRISTFNVVSILSGTGYVTSDFSLWGKFPLIFFLFLMFIGGCAGSTTCGIKIFRFQILGFLF